MNALDVILIILVAIGSVVGYRRGFLSSLFWVLGVLISWAVAIGTKNYLTVHCPSWHNVLAFLGAIGAFLASIFFVLWIGKYAREAIEKTFFGWIDSMLGAILGGAKVFIFVGVFVYMLQIIEIPAMQKLSKGSVIYPCIENMIGRIHHWVST